MKTPPKYVKLGPNGTALRLKRGDYYSEDEEVYYRDGGDWSINFQIKNNKIMSVSSMLHLSNIELIEITEEEWRTSNGRYADNAPSFDEYSNHVQMIRENAQKVIIKQIRDTLNEKRYSDKKHHDAILWKDVIKEFNKVMKND